jgi:hypothetical protein
MQLIKGEMILKRGIIIQKQCFIHFEQFLHEFIKNEFARNLYEPMKPNK